MNTERTEYTPKLWVGIDQSYSGFGLVTLDENGNMLSQDLWSFPPQETDGERLREIREVLTEAVDIISSIRSDSLGLPAFAMEDYAYGKTFNREKMGELGGVIKMVIPEVITYPPQTVKKFMTGNGRASKEEMLSVVQTHEPSITNHNVADAYAIARMLYSSQ